MKPFKNYLTESKKTYDFRVKIADCAESDEAMSKLESAFKKFDLQHMTKVKRLPMQNSTADFATLGPCEVTVFDVVLNYPVNDAQLRDIIHNDAGIPQSHIVVVPRFHPEVIRRDEEAQAKSPTECEALLTKPYGKETQVNPVAGDEYNKKMVKSLKSREFQFAKANSEKLKTTNELPVGNTSPLGSHKPKLPQVKRK